MKALAGAARRGLGTRAWRRGLAPRVLALLVGVTLLGLPPLAPPAGAQAAPAGYVARVSEGYVREIVAAGSKAYATNSAANRVEVFSLATRSFEAPIPVGRTPWGIDLSADGTRLYVANYESNDVSVVDLATRREVSRIPLPTGERLGRPLSIAVAANGTALVSRSGDDAAAGSRIVQIDLATGTLKERTDWIYSPSENDYTRLRASADRSRIGVTTSKGFQQVAGFYSAASDSFSDEKQLGSVSVLALDGTGSRMLTGDDTIVVDRDLVVRAKVPGSKTLALAVNRAGTTAYRLTDTKVEVIDLNRALVVSTMTLPVPTEFERSLALTPDEGTVLAATDGALSVIPVASAQPVPCTPASAPPSVLRVCGAPLAEVVTDGRGRAFATNRARNQVEVVSFANRSLEAPIPVGSQPRSLDISADGNTLYVVNTGTEDVSVVDLRLRREVRRITVPSGPYYDFADRPVQIAVAANGSALVAMRGLYSNRPTRLLHVDLNTGAVRERSDSRPAPYNLESSGDHSRIFLGPGDSDASLSVYSAATDTFERDREVIGASGRIAVDRTGSKALVGRGLERPGTVTHVFDGDLVLRSSIPWDGAMAVNAAGTTAYANGTEEVNVLDLQRGVATRYLPLPEKIPPPPTEAIELDLGKVALDPTETAVVALTESGVSIVSLAAARPARGCPSEPVPEGVLYVCGLAHVVFGPTGHAYVSNTSQNQIEVVALPAGTLEQPIPVGARPRGLDLSADGRTLYVATSGAEEISVVDLASRREVRRVPVPSVQYLERPEFIAVADNGKALITTTRGSYGLGNHILELDLATGASRLRTDYGGWSKGAVSDSTLLRASGDRSRIAVIQPGSPAEVSLYSSSTDTFSGEVLTEQSAYAALDRTGSRVLLGPSGVVLDGELREQGRFERDGSGVALTASGSTGYRAVVRQGQASIDVLDMDQRTIVGSLPIPDALSGGMAQIALSPDEATIIVLSNRGISIVPTRPMTQPAASSSWNQPSPTPLDGVGSWMAIASDPAAPTRQSAPSYLYGHYFSFSGAPAIGMIGLAADPGGKLAAISVQGPDGVPRVAAIPFNWVAGRYYFPLVYQLSPGVWGAWVYDNTRATWVFIGQLNLPTQWGKLSPATSTAAQWYGAPATRCSSYPLADVLYYPPAGWVGQNVTYATMASITKTSADCPGEAYVDYGVWARYRLGAAPAR